jgi:hypothetical protein
MWLFALGLKTQSVQRVVCEYVCEWFVCAYLLCEKVDVTHARRMGASISMRVSQGHESVRLRVCQCEYERERECV